MKDAVSKLKTALEDVTAACILEGFQRQDHVMMVDQVLKDLGMDYFLSVLSLIICLSLFLFFAGRAEAKISARTRAPTLTSNHFIQQYYMSFAEDPIHNKIKAEKEKEEEPQENGDQALR